MLFLYGFLSEHFKEPNATWGAQNVPLTIMQTVFTLIGFGLLLTNNHQGLLTGLSIAFFVVCYNYLLAPLFQDLWAHVFLYFDDLDMTPSVIAPTAQ